MRQHSQGRRGVEDRDIEAMAQYCCACVNLTYIPAGSRRQKH